MIDRYSVKSIDVIFKESNKISTWTKVEELICEAWNKLGVIPDEDLAKIKKNIKIDIPRMKEIEEETKHDVVAFTRMLSESLGDEKKWIHLGITSTDIVDTAQNYMIKTARPIVENCLINLENTLTKLAKDNRDVLIMGRTHGMYGEPTSLGLKFLLWKKEIMRQHKRINEAFDDVCVTKISGSMGNYANLELDVEEYVAQKLDMPADDLSTQVSQRDRLASLFLAFANLGSTYQKIATEIRLLSRSDVNEVAEGFSANQKGSSSMPHKKNPISSENVIGLSRMLFAYATPALENNVLWHERDISHSSNERIIIPDALNLVVYIGQRLDNILRNLVIKKDVMMKHIEESNGIFFSQPLMTYIIKNTNHSREEVYDFVQKCSMECLKTNQNFKDVLVANGVDKYISKKELDEIFDLKFFLRNVDAMYKKNHQAVPFPLK